MEAALERLRGLPFWSLVPGHGPPGGREAVEDQIRYFDSAARTVGEAEAFGVDPVAAIKALYPGHLLAVVLPESVRRFGA